jgi:hypothetical protein
MSLYKQFKTDENVEKDGVWLQYGLASNGKYTSIRIARAGGSNMKYQRLLEKKTKPYRRQLQMDMADEKVIESVLIEVYAEAVILDWENVEGPDGQMIPFSKENCIKLLRDLPDLFADIREQSTKNALFRAEIREQDAKN